MQFVDSHTHEQLSALVRQPAVAGTFYPANPVVLEETVIQFLRDAHEQGDGDRDDTGFVKAIIAPHAGYIYSGPIAASAYGHLAADDYPIKRIVLVGPAHFVPVRHLAVSGAEVFATPLGNVPVDEDGRAVALALPQVVVSDSAHEPEHCLEVQLPFLQTVCCDFTIVPLLVGGATEEEVAEVLEALWDGPGTRIVISSDLSHYLDYATARREDARTADAISHLVPEALDHHSACGRVAVGALLRVAARHNLTAETVDLRNSGDTAGPRDRVVGYGAFAFEQRLT